MKNEYEGSEQYAQEALRLVQSPTSFKVVGYKNNNGQVIRYDFDNNNFVKGHPDIGIATMYKPEDGIDYYYDRESEEAAW
jgi:pyocin large subunit-like protein